MSDEGLPKEHVPQPPRRAVKGIREVTYYIAVGKPETVIAGPWADPQEALDTNPQIMQGGLYAVAKELFIVKTDLNDKQHILYKWNVGGQKWVKEGE